MADWMVRFHESLLLWILSVATYSASFLGGPVEEVLMRAGAYALAIGGIVVFLIVRKELEDEENED